MTLSEALAASSDHEGHRIAYRSEGTTLWTAHRQDDGDAYVSCTEQHWEYSAEGSPFPEPYHYHASILPPDDNWSPRLCECHPNASAPPAL